MEAAALPRRGRRRRRVPLILALAASVGPAAALFADQVGVDDRSARHLGPISFASSASRTLLVASDAGAVASVNQRTGDITWRAVLPDGAS
jgi:hypothetical protein